MSYHGLGALAAAPAPGRYPTNLSAAYLASWPLTNASVAKPVPLTSPVAAQCNQSAQPVLCQWAKTQRVGGKTRNFLGKAATQADWDAWYKWSPPGDEPLAMDAKTGEVEVAGGVSDVVFYGGIAAAAVLVGGLVWYARR